MASNQADGLRRAFDTFMLDKQTQGLTTDTLLWYRRYVGALVDWLIARDVTTAGGITLELLRAYIAEHQGRGLAPKTVRHYSAAARIFCKWLTLEKLVPENPAERLAQPKVPKKNLPALTRAEVAKLLAECDRGRDRALLLFMLDTGTRCSETVAVNVGDVDTKTGAVTIAKGKGQKGRVVFLGVQARRYLLRYLLDRDNAAAMDPLWLSFVTGERLTTWGVTLILKRLGERAGVHVHPHMLRRTFAIWSLRAGMDVARLAALLGHSDLQTVQQYLPLAREDLQDAHTQHGAVDTLLATQKGR